MSSKSASIFILGPAGAPLLAEADAVLPCPLQSPSNNPGSRRCSPRDREPESQAQRDDLTCLWSHSWEIRAEETSRGQAWQRDLEVGGMEKRCRSPPPSKSPATAAAWTRSRALAPLPRLFVSYSRAPVSCAASSHQPGRNRLYLLLEGAAGLESADPLGRGRGLFLVWRLTQARRGLGPSPPPTHLLPASVISAEKWGKSRGLPPRPHRLALGSAMIPSGFMAELSLAATAQQP